MNPSQASSPGKSSATRREWLLRGAVALAALTVGAATLGGRFVGGDDHRLVLDHVLVSRPSLDHAWRLIRDVRPHRDLYQPVALLSFSAEFALLEAAGIRADLPWPDGGAWLFHLTNTLLHAVNALLVLALLRRWTSDIILAFIAAILFAVHPLQVETVAWVNGRMMLLSTLFALAALRAADRLCAVDRSGGSAAEPSPRDDGSAARPLGTAVSAALTVGFVLLSLTSKVRVGLPILMLLIPVLRRRRPGGAFRACWAASMVLTAALAWINIHATAEHDMFANAAAQMSGSRVVRCLLALAWYLEHFLWPSGLAAWYEAPAAPGWSDGATLRACGVLAIAAAILTWSLRRTRVGAICAAWFLLGIGDTLPIVPARNVLAADRYMYLPIIGLSWAAAAALSPLLKRSAVAADGDPAKIRRWPAAALVTVGAILILVSWRTAGHYVDMVAKTRRIVAVHPDSPWVHEKLAWALYNAGRYEEAIEAGRTEFDRFREVSGAEALTIVGLSQAALGDRTAAIQTLRNAASQKHSPLATYYLAAALADAPGHEDEAARLYRASLKELPNFNPGLSRAAAFFARTGRYDEARAMYEQVLVNNPFDLNATFELSRLDLRDGDPASAARRLEAALDWAPDFVQGRTNLGVCYERLGMIEDAVRQYEAAIAAEPRAVEALLNLARLNEEGGRLRDAETLLTRAVEAAAQTPPVCAAMHDFHIRTANPHAAAQFWTTVAATRELEPTERVRQACALALAGDFDSAEDVAAAVSPSFDAAVREPLDAALRAIEAWRDDRPAEAIEPIDRLAAATASILRPAQETLLASFLADLRQNPENPWLYYLCGALQDALGRPEVARAAFEVFIELCPDPNWRDHGRRRLQSLPR